MQLSVGSGASPQSILCAPPGLGLSRNSRARHRPPLGSGLPAACTAIAHTCASLTWLLSAERAAAPSWGVL